MDTSISCINANHLNLQKKNPILCPLYTCVFIAAHWAVAAAAAVTTVTAVVVVVVVVAAGVFCISE